MKPHVYALIGTAEMKRAAELRMEIFDSLTAEQRQIAREYGLRTVRRHLKAKPAKLRAACEAEHREAAERLYGPDHPESQTAHRAGMTDILKDAGLL